MGSLKDRLDRMREGNKKQVPAETLAVMARAHESLVASGIMNNIPRVGDAFPNFSLPDSAGQVVNSEDLLATGPLVVTFYRGVW